MADIIKHVDRGIPRQGRTQSFTQDDAVADDVIMVQTSLGRPANVMTVESAGGMSLRVNVYHIVAPPRTGNDLMYTEGMPNLALSAIVKNNSQALIEIDSSETFTLNDGIPINDIEIVTVSGNFNILVA